MNKKIKIGLLASALLGTPSIYAQAAQSEGSTSFFSSSTALWVVVGLVVLYLAVKFVNKVTKGSAQEIAKQTSQKEVVTPQTKGVNAANEEVTAAIAIALNEYTKVMTEKESNVLTINKVARAYSPWSSKIYGLRQIPEVRKR